MIFSSVTERLRGLAQRPGPVLVSVEGRPGLSPLPFVLEATDPARRLVFEPPRLTDQGNREALGERLRPFAARRPRADGQLPAWRYRSEAPRRAVARSPSARLSSADWPTLLAALPQTAPLTLVVNEPAGLAAVNRRFWKMLGEAWLAVRRRGQRVHLILVSSERGLGRRLNAPGSPFRDPGASLAPRPVPDPADIVQADPGSHYDLAAAVPEWRGRDLLLGWALFGGLPATWSAMRTAATVAAARSDSAVAPSYSRAAPLVAEAPSGLGDPAQTLRANLAWAGSPLGSAPRDRLEQRVQKTHRYAAILSAVARGATGWRQVADALGGSSSRGAVGPYLQRLRRLGLVVAERPLGASPSGRRTRYRLSDPFETLWWSALHPIRSELLSPSESGQAWRDRIEASLPSALDAVLPQICRNFLRFGCESLLGATARRAGPLWGEGFDFPVAATLENGAVCYAHTHAGPDPADLEALEALEAQMRRTRYGRGRQARIRLLVSLNGFTEPLRREAARSRFVRLADPKTLATPPKLAASRNSTA